MAKLWVQKARQRRTHALKQLDSLPRSPSPLNRAKMQHRHASAALLGIALAALVAPPALAG